MKVGFFPGSFDPFINGHLNVVIQASRQFDKVIVGLGINPLKIFRRRRFGRKLMKEAIIKVLKREKLENVEVIMFNSFFLRVALKYDTAMLIRGIRSEKDLKYEKFLGSIYKRLIGLDTMYIQSVNTSSTMVMEKIRRGENVEQYLPKEVWEIVKSNVKF